MPMRCYMVYGIGGDRMIIYADGNWQTDSNHPDSDFSGGRAVYVIPDDSALAAKIIALSSAVTIITDDSGVPIDAVPIVDRRRQILDELDRLDSQAVRPLRAIAAGTADEQDYTMLSSIETKAKELRKELFEISDAE